MPLSIIGNTNEESGILAVPARCVVKKMPLRHIVSIGQNFHNHPGIT
ncbi:hypothetical protein [Klebsiella pneumoniae IS22]|nr:hypothetical protein [Klebsiella pneumoniae IS22]